MSDRIFISYSQKDFLKRGRKVYNYLCKMFQDDHIYIDQSKVKGVKWRETNDKELVDSNLVILVVTPSAAIQSPEVRREIEIANKMKKQIIPCKLKSFTTKWEDLPFEIGTFDGIEFEDEEDLMTQLYSEITKIKSEYAQRTSNTVMQDFISVQTDKTSYSNGDKITITGTVKEFSGYPITLQIISPQGNLVTAYQLDVDPNKQYRTEIIAGGQLWINAGRYTVRSLYGSTSRATETQFSFEGSIITPSPQSGNTVAVEGTNFTIDYTIVGAKLLNLVKDTGTSSLRMRVESHEQGTISIVLPRDLLDAKKDNQDDVFFVLVNGAESGYSETSSSTHRTLTITFDKNTNEIEIIGTPVVEQLIPEFKPRPNQSSTNSHSITLSVSSDRTVYPLDSVVYLQASLNDVMLGKLIEFEIIDSKNHSMFSKKIDPRKHKPTTKSSGIYEINFKMNGKDWKIGETYIVKAKHGAAEAIDSFTIDERTPAIQTDKSVYIWGSDIIVTVIDPDADKDSNKAEFVGNRKDSKLIISSSQGTINGYKLRETGTSTGIFQGIIGIIGTVGNRTVNGYRLGKKIITKNQGKGIDDGFLKVERGGEIRFEYKNKSRSAQLVAYASNFGATVELDQKVYTWTDKVYITVVAPDYNLDSEKIDVIGNSKENKITISTSKGKLSGYKLVETGKNTGIFVGEIVLTGFKSKNLVKNKKFGITSGKGSVNGMVAASNEDLLEVKFNFFGQETVIGRAQIRWNIGEIQWLEQSYSTNDSAIVRVIDPDMNINPNKIDKFKIHVWSDSSPNGIDIVIYETNEATGIFEGKIKFNEFVSAKNELKVTKGDIVYAKYVDRTLPSPYTINDSLEIVAKTSIL